MDKLLFRQTIHRVLRRSSTPIMAALMYSTSDRGGKLLLRRGQIQPDHIPRMNGGRISDKIPVCVVCGPLGCGTAALREGPAQIILVAAQFGSDGHPIDAISRSVVRLQNRQTAAGGHRDGDGIAVPVFHQFPVVFILLRGRPAPSWSHPGSQKQHSSRGRGCRKTPQIPCHCTRP